MLGMIRAQLVQLPVVTLGTLYDLLQKLAGPNGQMWFQSLKRFLREEHCFTTSDIREEWQEFYRRYLRMSVDFSDIQILDNPGGFDRVIFIPKGLKLNDLIKVMRKHFKVWTCVDNLDKDVIENDRVADCNYVIRLRDREESDEELENTSVDQLKERGIDSITLLERLVYELKYWSETGQHLDIQNATLCAGSRVSNDGVPSVYSHLRDDEISIYWCFSVDSHVNLHSRQVVV